MSNLAELLTDCDARGIRLHPAGDGGLTIDAPGHPQGGSSALTPDIVARLKAHKAELLALLRPAAAVQAQPMPTMNRGPGCTRTCEPAGKRNWLAITPCTS